MLFLLVLAYWPLSLFGDSRDIMDRAFYYVGDMEIGKNRGTNIDKFNKFVGNRLGSPYCAAFVSYVTDGKPVKSGLARHHYVGNKHSAGDVLRGEYNPKYADKVIWARGKTIFGHIGLVIEWKVKSGLVIEGNTERAGKQGVYVKKRFIQPYNYFRIIGFVEN